MESSQLVKVFGLLEATAGHPDGRSLAELASEVSLAKPTAHRLLKTLVAMGYMERMGNGVYRQTAQLKRVVSGSDDARLVRVAEPLLRELHARTRETVNLGVLRVGRIVYLHVLESPQPLRRIVNPSMTDPFASTALGRAIVAQLPEERQRFLLLTTALEKRTPETVVDHDEILAAMREVTRVGHAIETNQTDLGVMCVGAPVFDAEGVAAAVSVSVPTVRAAEPQRSALVTAVRETAAELSRRLTEAPRSED